jgi:CRP-like cAMP-binding protein
VSAVFYASGNRLLDALPASDVVNLERDLTIVPLKAHQSTHSIEAPISHVDFPIDAVISVVAVLMNGDTVEVGTVGRESFVESEVALGSSLSSRTSFCEVQGIVARMSIECFVRRMDTGIAFARIMRSNVRAALFSSQQFTVCNAMHSVRDRCARSIAMIADRVGKPQFSLTHEFLAIMLGVRRSSVTEAADQLHQMGAIEYSRGVIAVVDAVVLEGIACECYRASKEAFASSLMC